MSQFENVFAGRQVAFLEEEPSTNVTSGWEADKRMEDGRMRSRLIRLSD